MSRDALQVSEVSDNVYGEGLSLAAFVVYVGSKVLAA